MKIAGVLLLVGGVLALVYGGFTYTKETHEAKIGPIVLSVKDKETVNVPIGWRRGDRDRRTASGFGKQAQLDRCVTAQTVGCGARHASQTLAEPEESLMRSLRASRASPTKKSEGNE